MKIFVINLKKSVFRREAITSRLDELGLEFELLDAVDGRDMSEEERRVHTKELNYAFLPGEIGCALSHQKAYKRMIDNNISEALILEDDALLPDCLPSLLSNEMLTSSKPGILLLSRVNKYIKKPTRSLNGIFSVHSVHNATTAHSYIINLSGAKNLLRSLYPIWMTSDKWSLFEDYSLVNIEAIIPEPVTLGENAKTSTINHSKCDDDILKVKKETWEKLMKKRPVRVRVKHRLRRAITPIFNKIIDQKKGPR
ncbi:glycosyltransferase family 25 protein [Erwinia sp. HDF1-3R]|uniref:glycosyltransferase family 25 protein n=1 Tax=Erwinia sp. HDF1-3R TaxID=3141543 RepID=UPI0031F4EF90